MLWNSPNSIVEKIPMFHSSRVIHFAVKQVMITIENTSVQDGAPKIAFSCLISGLTMVYGRYNYSIHGLYKVRNKTGGGGHPVSIGDLFISPLLVKGDHCHPACINFDISVLRISEVIQKRSCGLCGTVIKIVR